MASVKEIILWCALVSLCGGYKILAIFPMPMHSHHTLASKLVKELIKRDNEVTFVTPFPQRTNIKHLQEVSLEDIVPILNEGKKQLYGLNEQTVFDSVKFLTNMGYTLTELVLKNTNLQKLLHSKEKYDLVMLPQFLNEGLLGIAHHFKAPLVLVSPMPLFSWGSFLLSHPTPPSYVPNLLSQYTTHMNFWQRLCNSIYDVYSIMYHQWVVLPKHRELVRQYLPGAPDLYNFLNNASLLLINSHVSIYEAVPQVPNVVEIGGLHLEEPKKLPEELQTFLDDSVNGVVLFSMGTNLNSSGLDQNKRDAILKSFAKLNQTVLWKWEDDVLPGQPKNVKLLKWLPQSDLLAHSNVKAFITHGGLFSTMESIYHAVPTIGIPVFSDQKMNMASAASCGYAIVVPFQELTEAKLTHALNEILNNPRYKNNVVKRSNIMRDQLMKPLDSAMYWIEYVIRHQGSPHLRYSGIDLNWFQRYLVDVVAFVVAVGIIVIFILIIIFKMILEGMYQIRNKKQKLN